MENNWKSIDTLTSFRLHEVEVLFETGEIVPYLDQWPIAIATHWRYKYNEGEDKASIELKSIVNHQPKPVM